MWLLKTEPTAYSYGDLEKDGRTVWDGVTNPVALRNLRAMKVGDRCFVYHTGDEKAVVGIAKVVGEPRPPSKSQPRLAVVDLEAVSRLERPVALAAIRSMSVFSESPLVRQGRLSVVPLTSAQWNAVEKAGTK